MNVISKKSAMEKMFEETWLIIENREHLINSEETVRDSLKGYMETNKLAKRLNILVLRLIAKSLAVD